MEAVSDRYRLEIAGALLRLERELTLDREHKLIVLRAAIENLLPILLRLYNQPADRGLTLSNAGLSVFGLTEQLRAALADLVNREHAAKTLAGVVGRSRSSK